jgi:hypothetical protein
MKKKVGKTLVINYDNKIQTITFIIIFNLADNISYLEIAKIKS